MNRTIKKQFWFNKKEAELLQKKAKKACLTEASLVRKLVRDESIKEKPDEEFYYALRAIEHLADSIGILAGKVHSLDPETSELLEKEIIRWHRFQAGIEEHFLIPEKVIH